MLDEITQSVVDRIKLCNPSSLVKTVGTPNYFASIIPVNGQYIASCTDGVGSKVEHIIKHGAFKTIGIDCFAMNINDLLCVGANPISFQNHITTSKTNAHIIPDVIDGMVECCEDYFVVLSGGETEVLAETKFHISGSAWGTIVHEEYLIDGTTVEDGDVIIGLESNGLHANGWTSLYDVGFISQYSIDSSIIRPTKIYSPDILTLTTRMKPKAVINITGGGFRNLERIPVKNLSYDINHQPEQPVFKDIKTCFTHKEMYSTFNMGVGMMVIVSPENVDTALEVMRDSQVIGSVRKSLFESSVMVNGEVLTSDVTTVCDI
jgi:phosphoribosylformylglycinamidine cyclo-ligase